MPKKILRARLLAQRKSLPSDEFFMHSRVVQENFIGSSLFQSAGSLALYSPVHGEVGTEAVFMAALATGKKVMYPVVTGDRLVFRHVSTAGDLVPGTFGVLEPLATCHEVDVNRVDIIIVPAVGFDHTGNRIGYGKGYYDRALHQMEGRGRLIGFAFNFQIVEEIAGEPHDVRVDWIFTESRAVQLTK